MKEIKISIDGNEFTMPNISDYSVEGIYKWINDACSEEERVARKFFSFFKLYGGGSEGLLSNQEGDEWEMPSEDDLEKEGVFLGTKKQTVLSPIQKLFWVGKNLFLYTPSLKKVELFEGTPCSETFDFESSVKPSKDMLSLEGTHEGFAAARGDRLTLHRMPTSPWGTEGLWVYSTWHESAYRLEVTDYSESDFEEGSEFLNRRAWDADDNT